MSTTCTKCCRHIVGRLKSTHGPFAPLDADREWAWRCCYCGQTTTQGGQPVDVGQVTTWLEGCAPSPARFTPLAERVTVVVAS